MHNYMEEVARLIGVELNEEFELVFDPNSTCHATIKLTTDGVKIIKTDVYDIFNFKSNLLEHLLKGNYGIKKKPWKPKYDEKYYSIGVDGNVENNAWLNDTIDRTLYKVGNCYHTAEEARINCIKWKEFYDSDEILTI